MTLSKRFTYQHSLVNAITVMFLIAGYALLNTGDLYAQFQNPCSPKQIGVETFKQRRQALLDSLGEGAAALYSQGSRTDAGYRADANFWYLTGIDEEGAILVLEPG
ncbi:MAG: aminopeptidase P N-terminal domain-containing protein, partial [candidate division Zixibacteria bacterium]|nr:aminopeptidase P N-terminal domain-containing protein [candidate division Zixibacteria bacterium]